MDKQGLFMGMPILSLSNWMLGEIIMDDGLKGKNNTSTMPFTMMPVSGHGDSPQNREARQAPDYTCKALSFLVLN
jgi:hypothetical protein